MIEATPKFVQGVFAFAGAGYDAPSAVASYTVAADKRAQPVYLRTGNSSDALVVLTLTRNGELMRLFPVGAKAALHVPLAVVEDISPETVLELSISAPTGVEGTIVLDFGLLEV